MTSAVKKALLRAVTGSVTSAAKAHPDAVSPHIAGSIAKRVAGQLLAQFKIEPKSPRPAQ